MTTGGVTTDVRVPAGVCVPAGFRVGGATAGIKASGRPDLALFAAADGVTLTRAGVFTRNLVFGAPVKWSRARVPSQAAGGVIINSGNANACTGDDGDRTAEWMATQAAAATGCDDPFLVASTGIIGHPLATDGMAAALPGLAASLGDSPSDLHAAAEAMMTTDTVAKLAGTAAAGATVAGVAKGAAMIHPNMGTMLAVVLTDAALTPDQADRLLRAAVDQTFNRITIDGHTSTSDTVFLLASGRAGAVDDAALAPAVTAVCDSLAQAIVRDGEGAGHFVTLTVDGFDSDDAARIGRAVANDALVKTAITGNDPNWGRIVSACGWSGVAFDPAHLSLHINGTAVFADGHPVPYDEAALSSSMAASNGEPLGRVDLRLTHTPPCPGAVAARFYTTDLTQEYVRLNSEYTT